MWAVLIKNLKKQGYFHLASSWNTSWQKAWSWSSNCSNIQFFEWIFLIFDCFVTMWILYLSLLLHFTSELYGILILSICSKIYLGIRWLKNTSSWMHFAQTEWNSCYAWQHKTSSTYLQDLKGWSFPGEAGKRIVIKVRKHRLSQGLRLAERYKKCVYTDKAVPCREKLIPPRELTPALGAVYCTSMVLFKATF